MVNDGEWAFDVGKDGKDGIADLQQVETETWCIKLRPRLRRLKQHVCRKLKLPVGESSVQSSWRFFGLWEWRCLAVFLVDLWAPQAPVYSARTWAVESLIMANQWILIFETPRLGGCQEVKLSVSGIRCSFWRMFMMCVEIMSQA